MAAALVLSSTSATTTTTSVSLVSRGVKGMSSFSSVVLPRYIESQCPGLLSVARAAGVAWGIDGAVVKPAARGHPRRSFASAAAAAGNIEGGRFTKIHIDGDIPKRELPAMGGVPFGRVFTDHMVKVDWELNDAQAARLLDPSVGEAEREEIVLSGWGVPRIQAFGNISLHPASQCLHYGSEVFEGMKAFRSESDTSTINLFRPELNARRLVDSTKSLGLPHLPESCLIQLIEEAVHRDARWVPSDPGCSLYIRPVVFGTNASAGLTSTVSASLMVLMSPVGRYFKDGLKPISLLLEDIKVRAWPGGIGHAKAGGNYAPTLKYQSDALREYGCSQVLYALPRGDNADEAVLSESGAMNFFALLAKEGGGKELVTAPLDGTILPGVTRQSVLDICREWGEFSVSERFLTVGELKKSANEGRLLELFGCGTAVLICPVNRIKFRSGEEIACKYDVDDPAMITNRIRHRVEDIQYGRTGEHPWTIKIDDPASRESAAERVAV